MRQTLSLAIVLFLMGGCAQVSLAPKYLARCPAEGPEPADDLGLRRLPLELGAFYSEIRARSDAFEIAELGVVSDGEADYPILSIRRRGPPAPRKILVVAGIHGNETAGILAVPEILDILETDRPEYRSSDVTIVVPANPVGVVHGSRYNASGCDLNRDFRNPQTYEARVIHDLILAQAPELIVSFHEGPQDGYLLVATSEGSERLAGAAVRAVQERGIGLASTHFAGFSLGTPGLSAEGAGTDLLKWALQLNTLGWFANSLGSGTYTTETSWSSENFDERVLAHVTTVEALLLAVGQDGGLAAQQGVEPDVE